MAQSKALQSRPFGFQPGNDGRPPGARNKKTLEALRAVDTIRASGSTPLEEMWKIANGVLPKDEKKRADTLAKFRMMAEIAPYVHPRLAALAVQTDAGAASNATHEELLDMLDAGVPLSSGDLTEDDVEQLDESLEVFPAKA